MKKTIKTFVDRLRNAWSTIKGDDYIFVSFEKGVNEQYALYTTSLISGVRLFSKNNSVSIYILVLICFWTCLIATTA